MLKKIFLFVYVLLILVSSAYWLKPVSAVTASVVISEVQVDGATSASQEFIEIYNNLPSEISLNGWTVEILSASGTKTRTITLSDILNPYSYALIASTAFEQTCLADFPCYSANMSETGGHVLIVDSLGGVIDRVGWGTAIDPEGVAIGAPADGSSIHRKAVVASQSLQDTNNNSVDFQPLVTPSPTRGGLSEPIVDICSNIEGVQSELPSGYESIGDVCQLIQNELVPNCQGITINEIVPNPEGTDTGKEFIELYNQQSYDVSLDGCVLTVGTKQLALSGMMNPGYKAFYGLVLPNASGGTVTLITNTTEEVVSYPGSLADDESYSLIHGTWYKGALSTPDEENQLAGTTAKGLVENSLDECPAGKFRNPETNRCKNIEVASLLSPCDSDEYRNPETNRCRKIISSASTSPAPCKSGYERNIDTNRCRKVAGTKTSNPLSQPASIATKPVNYSVIAIVAIFATTYGIYEYRQEIRSFLTRQRRKP